MRCSSEFCIGTEGNVVTPFGANLMMLSLSDRNFSSMLGSAFIFSPVYTDFHELQLESSFRSAELNILVQEFRLLKSARYRSRLLSWVFLPHLGLCTSYKPISVQKTTRSFDKLSKLQRSMAAIVIGRKSIKLCFRICWLLDSKFELCGAKWRQIENVTGSYRALLTVTFFEKLRRFRTRNGTVWV